MPENPSLDFTQPGALLAALGLRSGDLDAGLTVGANLRRKGEGIEALRLFATMALCEPTNFSYQLALADCAAELDQPYLAIQAAAVLITLEPKDPRGYFISGRSCLQANLPAEAREDLSRAVSLSEAAGIAPLADECRRLLAALDTAPQPAAQVA
ncbi:hypothetical protein [Aureimonas leprariae]|uniref:Uncharacterized protein n=1 Tax=Plantimonas leprariae TaxID=2615207 RepID=A0A7V7PL37_9HYPH|nr:hypothetical protein [Aureimonas leprariae]KAB0676863.1 hypothetical protein F6X38_20035 [Aureimonas leprariae]